MYLMDGPAPRYLVLDDAPQIRGLSCTADELAATLRAPLAAVGVRVVRQRGATSKSLFSEFQARGMSRRQYDAKTIQVAQIVDEVAIAYQRHDVRVRHAKRK
jgi:hypothetical protein